MLMSNYVPICGLLFLQLIYKINPLVLSNEYIPCIIFKNFTRLACHSVRFEAWTWSTWSLCMYVCIWKEIQPWFRMFYWTCPPLTSIYVVFLSRVVVWPQETPIPPPPPVILQVTVPRLWASGCLPQAPECPLACPLLASCLREEPQACLLQLSMSHHQAS